MAATTTTFSIETHARWADMDFNAHMRNAAYLGAAEDCRMQYFAAHGFPMQEFEARRVGPVVRRDELEYHREMRLLDRATVTLSLAGLSPDGARMRLRNRVVRSSDGLVAATVTSTGGWLDLEQRRLCAPPDAIRVLLEALPRDDDFEELSSLAR